MNTRKSSVSNYRCWSDDWIRLHAFESIFVASSSFWIFFYFCSDISSTLGSDESVIRHISVFLASCRTFLTLLGEYAWLWGSNMLAFTTNYMINAELSLKLIGFRSRTTVRLGAEKRWFATKWHKNRAKLRDLRHARQRMVQYGIYFKQKWTRFTLSIAFRLDHMYIPPSYHGFTTHNKKTRPEVGNKISPHPRPPPGGIALPTKRSCLAKIGDTVGDSAYPIQQLPCTNGFRVVCHSK